MSRQPRPPEQEARFVIAALLVIMVILVIVVVTVDMLGTRGKSILLIGWMAAMMVTLRRYRLS